MHSNVQFCLDNIFIAIYNRDEYYDNNDFSIVRALLIAISDIPFIDRLI